MDAGVARRYAKGVDVLWADKATAKQKLLLKFFRFFFDREYETI